MSVVLATGGINHLTLDEHIERLLRAQTKIRDSLYEFIDALKDAHDQLPENTFQNELGFRLGMKKSVLSKWLAIGSSDYLMRKRNKLPSAFSSLYVLTLIEKKYRHQYGEDCNRIMDRLIENGHITTHSERSDLESILQEITQRIRQDDQIRRQDRILSLSGGQLSSDQVCKSLDEYLEDKTRFRSFVVIPSETQISEWSNGGYFPTDIAEEFPLHDLRAPSVTETLSCLIKVKMKDIETGIKLLKAWGFSYRDTIVPPMDSDHCIVMDHSYVLVRGERGHSKSLNNKVCLSLETDDILEFVEQNSPDPSLLVFDTTNRSDWSCLVSN